MLRSALAPTPVHRSVARPFLRRALRPLLVPALLAGCSLGPALHLPPPPIDAAFRTAPDPDAPIWPEPGWWRGFGSPVMSALIEDGRAHNPSVAAAVARIRQADAQVRLSGAALLPTVNANGSGQYSRSSTGPNGGNRYFDQRTYAANLAASYEVDLWGRIRALDEAAIAAAAASRFDRETIALTTDTAIANTWIAALAYGDRLAVARDNLRDAEQTLAFYRGRLDAGLADALSVAQEETQVAIQRANIPGLQNQIEQNLAALGLLTGVAPAAIDARPGTLTELTLPPVAPGLPSDLLARRPDVAFAEANIESANGNLRSARAAFFPALALTGQSGYQSAALGTLFGPGGLVLAAGAQLTRPIFDGGTLRGNLELTQARQDELIANYKLAVLQAFQDTDQALAAWRFLSEQEARQQEAVHAAETASTVARAQLRAGTVDITAVLQAQTTLYGARDTLVQVQLARAQALISLYRALGGGWIAPQGPAVASFPGLSPSRLRGAIVLPGDAYANRPEPLN